MTIELSNSSDFEKYGNICVRDVPDKTQCTYTIVCNFFEDFGKHPTEVVIIKANEKFLKAAEDCWFCFNPFFEEKKTKKSETNNIYQENIVEPPIPIAI